MTRPGAALALALVAAAVACAGAPPRRVATPPAAARRPPSPPSPARWILARSSRVETRDDGAEHVIAEGRRFVVRDHEIAGAAAPEPPVDGGARLPTWVTGDVRYVFWRGRALYGAGAFDAPLRPLGEVRADVRRPFDWLGGVGLELDGGVAVVDGAGRIAPAALPGVQSALAVDARRAAEVTLSGRLRVTFDGGATRRDVSLGAAVASGLEVRRGVLVVRLDGGARRAIDASAALVEPPPVDPPRREPEPDPWPSGSRAALAALAASGLPFDGGGAIVAGAAHVGRLDLGTLRTTAIASLPGVDEDADCAPFRAQDALLALCAHQAGASVVDVGGAPRIERSFAIASEDLDRFVGVDETGALGFLGPCSAGEAGRPVQEGDRTWPAASPVFCVRLAGGQWVEHRAEPNDVRRAVAWIPRPDGGAALLVGEPAEAQSAPRVERRGALRIVRISRGAPPVPVGEYPPSGGKLLDRAFAIGADDAIEGWLPTSDRPSVHPVRIDASGRIAPYALPPRTLRLAHAGPVALAVGDDGAWHQSLDRGRTWSQAEPPPAAVDAGQLACGPLGCATRGFTRIGWDARPRRVAPPEPWRNLPEGRSRRRSPPTEPIARLVCRGAAPPVGARIEDSFGFGVTPSPVGRGEVTLPIGRVGVAQFPQGAKLLGGDVELGWIAPLDLAGRVRRARMPASRAGVSSDAIPYMGLSVAPVLRADGGIDLAAARPSDACFDAFLEAAGVVRPGLGCVEARTVGAEVGPETWFVRAGPSTTSILARPSPGARGARGPARWVEATGPGAHGRLVAIGARAGSPVLAFVDVDGAATLTPLGPGGAVGPDEPLRSLADLALATAPACGAARSGSEAVLLLAFEGTLAVHAPTLSGVSPDVAAPGLAVVRWSRERACLEAVELPVRDERVDIEPGTHEGATSYRRVIARFGGRQRAAALIDVGPGFEVRQPLICDAVAGAR